MSTILLKPLSKKISRSINIPGSKSYTNRALIMASLASGNSTLHNYSLSADSLSLIKVLKELGIIIKQNKKVIIIKGNAGKFKSFIGRFNMKAAGTSSRFIVALAALIPGKIIVDGSDRLRQRPISELAEAIKDLGAKINYLQQEGHLPLQIEGGKLNKNVVAINGFVSSQYFTALLLVAALFKEGLTINVLGEQVSKSYIDMTIDSLRDFGIKVENKRYKQYFVSPKQKYQAIDYQVEIDASGSSYFFAIAAITGSRIRVNNLSRQSLQGDAQFPWLLEKMGCIVIEDKQKNWIEVTGPQQLKGIETNMESMPDTAQTLAVVAAFAQGKTKITGLSTLRVKETNRLAATNFELAKMGIDSKITSNSIEIIGGDPKKAMIETYKDHRMAMSFAVAGAKLVGMQILDPAVVNKSFPSFWKELEKLGINIKEI